MQRAYLEPSKARLHLGAGKTHMDGFVNCDLYPGEGIDTVFDLMKPWPFEDNSCDGIYASHVLEHLPDHRFFFREAWRVLDDRREMRLRVPSGSHRSAWCDPTHLRPWYPESFAFLQPQYAQAVGNPQHDAWDAPFLVGCVGLKVSGWVRKVLRWKWLFHAAKPWFSIVPDAIEELWCDAYALKAPASLLLAEGLHHGNAVPVRWLIAPHDWEQRAWVPTEGFTLLDVSGRIACVAY